MTMRLLTLVAAMCFAAIAAGGSAQAGESRLSSDGFFQRVASKPCCYNSGEYFNSTPSTCRRYGGRVVPYEYCERSYYQHFGRDDYWNHSGKPCCYNNGQFFNTTPKTCRKYGGRVVRQERCNHYYYGQWGDDGRWGDHSSGKPCCYNRGQYYNTSARTCRKHGGEIAPQRYCWRYN